MGSLSEVAREADATILEARARLVAAVRQAKREGMTQQEIAQQIGRSQPEVSRLLRFHGTSPQARRLTAARKDVIDLIKKAGGRDVRVFGSVARGTDSPESDVDLMFDMRSPMGLIALGDLESAVSAAVGAPVDLVPIQLMRPDLRDRVLQEAVAL